jgi:sugar phosphate isomerase/epimerase
MAQAIDKPSFTVDRGLSTVDFLLHFLEGNNIFDHMRILLSLFLFLFCGTILAQKNNRPPEIGIAQNIENDSLVHAAGYRHLVESAAKLIWTRSVNDTKFQDNVTAIKKLRTPMYAYNIFMPGELKLVGPEVNEAAVLAHAEAVFVRCRETGVKMIVWGSGGSRRIPDGFDAAKAKTQFIDLAKKVSARAGHYNITLALENLNSTETNFINTAEEALDIVKKVNSPQFKLCADIYHMLMENESPAVIGKAGNLLVHCDIAEKEGRTPPGVHGQDFRPYLEALKKIQYKGTIILECRWQNVGTEAAPAYRYLKQQLDEVYGVKP